MIENQNHQLEVAQKLLSRKKTTYTKLVLQPQIQYLVSFTVLGIMFLIANIIHYNDFYLTELARLTGSYQSTKAKVLDVSYKDQDLIDLTLETTQHELLKITDHKYYLSPKAKTAKDDHFAPGLNKPLDLIVKGDEISLRRDLNYSDHVYFYTYSPITYFADHTLWQGTLIFPILLFFALKGAFVYFRLKKVKKNEDYVIVTLSNRSDLSKGKVQTEAPYYELKLEGEETIYFRENFLTKTEKENLVALYEEYPDQFATKIYMYNIDNPRDERYFIVTDKNS